MVLMSLDNPRVPRMNLSILSVPIPPMRASLLQSKFDTSLLVHVEYGP